MRNVSTWILVTTIGVLPLVLAPGLQAYDITPKLLVLLVGSCAVWLALAFEGNIHAPRNVVVIFGILALCGLLSTLLSSNRVLSLVGSEWRRMGLPAWVACLALAMAVPTVVASNLSRRRLLLQTIVIAGTLAALYSFAQFAGHDHWIAPALYRVGEGEWQIVRPPATFGYVSYFALYESAAMFLAAGLALSSRTLSGKWGWGTAAIVIATAIAISGSRGALLGAALGAIALVSRVTQIARRRLLLGFLAAILVAGALFVSPVGQPLRSRIRWFVEDPQGGARLYLWRDSLKLAAAHPLVGVGLEAFGRSFSAVESLDLARHFPDFYVESPHNVFLDYLCDAGLPALLLFVGLIVLAVRASWSRTDSLDAAQFAALLAAVATAQFVGDVITSRVLILSLAALCCDWRPHEPQPGGGHGKYGKWVVASLASLALAASCWFSVHLVRADRLAWRATDDINRGNVEAMLADAEAANNAFPWGGGYAFTQSRLIGQVALLPSIPAPTRQSMFQKAESAANAALADCERPQNVRLHLATLDVMQGRYPQAQTELEETIRLAPSWYRPRWQLALLLWQAGRKQDAAKQAAAALDRGARSSANAEAQCQQILNSMRQ